MSKYIEWVEAHPVIVSMVLVPLIVSLVNGILRPRTPEEYAELPPRLAAFLKLLRALFPDPQKAAKAIAGIAMGAKATLTPFQKRIEFPPPMVPDAVAKTAEQYGEPTIDSTPITQPEGEAAKKENAP